MKLLIAAGGTGGHVFPGLAVAEGLSSVGGYHEAVFVGTKEGLEARVIQEKGFIIYYIKAHQFTGRSLFYKIATLARLVWSIFSAMRVIKKERPTAILGMGGFTSVPLVIAGYLLKYPCFIHEQNVEAGLANRLLAKYARRIFISFEETAGYGASKKIQHTGNPLRKSLGKPVQEREAGKFTVFVFGGSRGARSINNAVIDLLPFFKESSDIAFFHQTGAEDYEKVLDAYKKNGVEGDVFPFTDTMEKYYNMCDLVLSRAGATSIFELAYFKKPAILVPFPFSAGQHQLKNARYVENVGGAYLIGNDEANGERLYNIIVHLMKERELLKVMGEKIGEVYVEDSAERIIRGIQDGVSQN